MCFTSKMFLFVLSNPILNTLILNNLHGSTCSSYLDITGCILFLFLNYLFFYLFLNKGEGREKGRKTSMCGCLSCAPYWRPDLQTRHMTWLGIEPVTLCFSGLHSIHWATPARELVLFLIKVQIWKAIDCSLIKT